MTIFAVEAGRVQSVDQGWVHVWDTLSDADRSLLRDIMADRPLITRMHMAWAQTLRDGLERNFWIVRPTNRTLASGRLWTGSPSAGNSDARLERLFFNVPVVANYHTHPGDYWQSGFPSWADHLFNRDSHTLGILQTRFGFTAGRLTHYEWRRRR